MTLRGSGGASLQSVEVRLLRAALLDDKRERDRIIAMELDDGWPFRVVVSAVGLVARRRFDDRWDRRAILAFARRFVTRAPGGAGFAVRDVEAVLRGATGDPHLLAGTSDADNLPELYYALLLALADDLGWGDAEVEGLLADAVRETAAALELGGTPEEVDADPAILRRYRRIHRRYLTDADMVPSRGTPPREPSPLTAEEGVRGYPEPATRAGRYLRSYLVGVKGPAVREVDDKQLYLITRSALNCAVLRYLPPEADIREIARFVRVASEAYPGWFHPMKAEYMVRLLMGERDVPLDGMTKKDIYVAGSMMLQVIAVASQREDAALCPVIVEAEELLAGSGYSLAR